MDTNDDSSMDETYFTYVDDEHAYNHDYDDNIDVEDDNDDCDDVDVRWTENPNRWTNFQSSK